ncbi:MAG: hypothetical protein II517_04185 [Ruminococcus sp.]|nr:hypothetical protein [Ruminococcus sp.]MBQ2487519.1 hypothetical protein [Ruminococcus sp.]
MYYYTIEIQNRADGIDNVQPIVARQSLASGLSYFYSRCSAMAGTTLYPTVTLMLIDSNGTIIENKHLKTAYVEPVEGE